MGAARLYNGCGRAPGLAAIVGWSQDDRAGMGIIEFLCKEFDEKWNYLIDSGLE